MSTVCVLIALPEALVRFLFCEWLNLKELCSLDSAFCNRELREQFAAIASGCVFRGTDGIFDPDDDACITDSFWDRYVGWLLKRSIRVSSICIRSESLVCSEYLAKYGSHITNLQYLRNHSLSTLDNFPIVCRSCPNLQKVRFPLGISPNMVIKLGESCKLIQELNYYPMSPRTAWTLAHYQAINAAYPCLTTIVVCHNTPEVYRYVLQEFPKLKKVDLWQPMFRTKCVPLLVALQLTKKNLILEQLCIYAEISTEVLCSILSRCPNIQHLDVSGCVSGLRALNFTCIAEYCQQLRHLHIHMASMTDTEMHVITQCCPLLKEVSLFGYLSPEATELRKMSNFVDCSESVYLSAGAEGLTAAGVAALLRRSVHVAFDQDNES